MRVKKTLKVANRYGERFIKCDGQNLEIYKDTGQGLPGAGQADTGAVKPRRCVHEF
eukprot:COSAG05_NODE_868_length_6866_cov_131.011231_2_plen_56_part_00